MKLQEQLNRIQEMMVINETYNHDDVKSKYILKKIVNNEQFDEIKNLFPNYQQFIWILKKLELNCITIDQIKDFVNYLDVFNKNKKEFVIQDLGQIKTCEQVNDFINKVNFINEDKSNFIRSSDIIKLQKGNIKYLGEHDGFQVFVIPSLKTMEKLNINPLFVFSLYRKILSNCENRTEENKINFCTTGGFNYFNMYIRNGELFVFHKKGDKNSPFQIGVLNDKGEELIDCKNKNNKYDKNCSTLIDIYKNNKVKDKNSLMKYFFDLFKKNR